MSIENFSVNELIEGILNLSQNDRATLENELNKIKFEEAYNAIVKQNYSKEDCIFMSNTFGTKEEKQQKLLCWKMIYKI
jgi:hypothetical protein